ncbi:type II toxin-antitoxin system RelE/ParE family toxin [Sphingomonas sp. LR60]|uniref:type II toxin-antitoxin system RelE/ParE family toxin n=1 Tax=Sphingomonas sp. LR60 TaxID=3050233 RepID=UPI002FE2B19F
MPITIISASKPIADLLSSPPGKSMPDLQPKEAKKIRRQISVITAANSMVEIKKAHPEWRVHRYKGNVATWSFDVGGATRLLMEWDDVRKEVSNVRFENSH